jgi:hypothetical protein
MGGNEGGLDAAVFLFRWRRRGDRGGGVRPAGGSAVRARLRCGRKKKGGRWAVRVGWVGRKAKAQWEGEGKSVGKKKKNWAERPDGLKVTGKFFFRIKFDFGIYQGFGNLHKEI